MTGNKLTFTEFKKLCIDNDYKKYIFDYSNQINYMDCEIRKIHMDFNRAEFVTMPPNCIILSNKHGYFVFVNVVYVLPELNGGIYRDVFDIVCADSITGTETGFKILADKI